MGKKKGEKLNDFIPNENESSEDRIRVLEAHLAEIIKIIKEHSKQIETRGQQVDSLVNLYGMISDTVKVVEEKTYPGDIANAIREIKEVLTARPSKEVCVCPDETPASITDLNDIPNRDLLDIEYRENMIIIKPKQFLGDLWSPVMDFVRTKGGNWIKDDKHSRWEIGGAQSSSTQAKKNIQIKNPNAPATERQIAWLKKQNIFVKPDLKKGEASKLIERRMGEIEAKKKK